MKRIWGKLTAIELLARPCSISPVRIADKRKSLRSSRLPIFSQEHASDAAEAFEYTSEVVFFGEFGDLEDQNAFSAFSARSGEESDQTTGNGRNSHS